MKRTASIDVYKDFTVEGEVVKAWTDQTTGERFIRGVASGVEVDRDGERVTKRAIRSMVDQINSGGVKLTSAHQQDWFTEFGDVVKGEHDPETHQLVIDTKLPPEGVDPVADKAWNTTSKGGEPIGFSIGGKLRKAFYELDVDTGKRRKALDDIALRHVMLTKNPAYQHSFAEAVAKTFDGEPAQAEFTEDADPETDAEPVAKATVPDPAEDVEKGLSPGGGDSGNSGQDSKTGDRNAGSKGAKSPVKNTEKPDAEPTADDEPKTRKLACPHCGHEFAADLPSNEDEMSNDDGGTDDHDHRTGKTRPQETTMTNVEKAREKLEELVALLGADSPAEDEPTEKTEASSDDVAKQIADAVEKVEKTYHGRVDELEGKVAEAFETIAKQQAKLVEFVGSLPLGRRSTARVLPPRGEQETAEVGKSVEDAPDALAALKTLNAATYGIR